MIFSLLNDRIIALVLCGIFVFSLLKVVDKSTELDKPIHAQALMCTENTIALSRQISTLFDNKCIDMLMDEENLTRVEVKEKYVPAIKNILPQKQ